VSVATNAPPADAPAAGRPARPARRRRARRWTRGDKLALTLMIGIPTVISVSLVWLPALASVGEFLGHRDERERRAMVR